MAEYTTTAPAYLAGVTPDGAPVVGSAICRRGSWEVLVVCWPLDCAGAAVVGMGPTQDIADDIARRAALDPWPWFED
jgi:hypothetical protein